MWHDPDDRLQKAVDRYEEGDRPAARAMLRALDRQGVISPRIDLYLGHLHLEDDNPRAALRRYRRAAALKPRDAAPWVGIALCEGRMGRIERALEALRRAARLDPAREEVHCHLVHCHALLGDLAEAEAHAQRAVRLDPSCPHVHRHLAVAYLVAGKPAEALEAWARVAALDPQHPELDLGRARCLAAMERRREARVRYGAALRGPYAADAEHGLGELDLLEERWDRAAERFRAAVARDPDHEAARLGWARAEIERGGLEAAREVLEPLGDGDPEVASLRARLLVAAGRRTEALRGLRVGWEATGREVAWGLLLGEQLLALGRPRAAAWVLARARRDARRREDPGWEAATRLLARARGRRGRRREAVTLLARAAWRADATVEVHLDLAAAQLARGRVGSAEAGLLRALVRHPDAADLWAAAAELACEGGRRRTGRERLARALRADRRHLGALALLVRWLLERGRVVAAVHAARAAARVAPPGHPVLKDQGRALLRCGRFAEASIPLRRYVLATPGDAEGYRLLAQAMEAVGELRAAQAQRRLGQAVEAAAP